MLEDNKERIIEVIENRILSEHRKHSKSLPDDWAKIAAHKIFASLSESKTKVWNITILL